MLLAKKTQHNFEYFLLNKESSDSREEIYRLWYDIYSKEMKRNLKYANHIDKTLIDTLEPHSHIVIAANKNKIIGTFRINLPEDCDLGYYNELYQLESFRPHEIAIGTRYMVSPDYRGNYISQGLMMSAIRFLANIGKKYLIIDCNSPIHNLFKKMGFNEYLEERYSHEFGTVRIMKYRIK